MSLFSIFTDAFKRASTARSDAAKDAIKSGSAGTLGSTTQSGGGSFTPLRPAPESSPNPDLGDAEMEVALAPDPTPVPYPNTGAEPEAELLTPAQEPMTLAYENPFPDIKGEAQDKFEALRPTRLVSDPDVGGESKFEALDLTRPSADPEEGGESEFALRLDRGPSDPEEGGEPQTPEEGGESGFALRLDRGSSDPEEGGESKFEFGKILRRPGDAADRRTTEVADQEEGGEPEFEAGTILRRSSDPEEGGELNVRSPELTRLSSDPEEGGESKIEALKLRRPELNRQDNGEDPFGVKIEHVVASDNDLYDDEPSTLVQLAPSARIDGLVGASGGTGEAIDDLDLDGDLDGDDQDLED